jgi:hypothetical protein
MTWPRWSRRAARNWHRHAIEQASHRWRGGRREDSARTRRIFLISTQVKIQHDIAEIMAGCTRGTYAADAAKIRVDELLAEAIEEISKENERIESLTQARRSYYSAASARWELLRRIEFRTTQRAVQPLGWGGRSSEAATFLGDRRTRYLRLARDHARELMAYFRSTPV